MDYEVNSSKSIYNKIVSAMQATCPSFLYCNSVLRIISEQSIEMNSPLFLIHIKFDPAFDIVDRSTISQCLAKFGVDEATILEIIHILYGEESCRLRIWDRSWQQLEIKEREPIELLLSRMISFLVLHSVLEKSNANATDGIRWGETELHHLIFQDEICLMARTVSAIQRKLQELALSAREVGLQISAEETTIMRISTSGKTPVRLNDVTLRDVKTFCFLGSIFSKFGGIKAEVKQRLSSAKYVFQDLRERFVSADTIEQKMAIFNSRVKPVLLYGCETWSEPKWAMKKLQKFVNNCMRVMLPTHPRDQRELLNRCGEDPIQYQIRYKKWLFIGEVLRTPNTIMTARSFQWNPQGSRSVGRPSFTFNRTVEDRLQKIGPTWPELILLAQDSNVWTQFIEQYIYGYANRRKVEEFLQAANINTEVGE
ncbi:uncharacterized protein LOC109611884 isoform X2 [Musca domestica]|uniref:Uncharacterized protein LOC109611884 isoform X2 n=1 Tax=Musca domestica TaxID=7370 RepID=A0ABM3V4D5_MUSDO|nr:uncharacterized protein LOC109611884 isoform X2 [Musca domestica]